MGDVRRQLDIGVKELLSVSRCVEAALMAVAFGLKSRAALDDVAERIAVERKERRAIIRMTRAE